MPPLVPFAVEKTPAPADQFIIKSVHVSGLAAEIVGPLYAVQKNIASLQGWLAGIVNPFD